MNYKPRTSYSNSYSPRRPVDGFATRRVGQAHTARSSPGHQSVRSSSAGVEPVRRADSKYASRVNDLQHGRKEVPVAHPPNHGRRFTKHGTVMFSAGALFSAGLIAMGFYMGISRPSALAEGKQVYSVEVPVESVATHVTGQPQQVLLEQVDIEVDAGIDVADVDWSPPPPPDPTHPSRFIIDKFNQNNPIRSLGLSRSGAIAVPNYTSQVGWFNESVLPGNSGTAVMDGHYGIPAGTAAFGRLHELVAGDTIKIQTHGGDEFVYEVERIESYSLDNVPMAELISSDGTERLNLITCNGGWSRDAGTYESRLIVYTKRI